MPDGAADGDGTGTGDDLLAVIAHSLLSSISLVVGGVELLSSHWRALAEEERDEVLASTRVQARYIAAVLDNLVRLGDPMLIEALEGLGHDGAPHDGARHDGARHDGARHDGAGHDGARSDGAACDGAGRGGRVGDGVAPPA